MIKLVDIGVIVLSSGLFLLCYLLFLRKEKYHQLNRAYLLFSLTFSSLLPFIRFSLPEQPLMSNTQIFLTTVTKTSTIPFGTILYVAGAVVFFILFLLKLFKVLRQIIGKHYNERDGLKVIDNPGQKAPFSFFRYIVVDSAAFDSDELDLVLRHEAAHARQWHTLDLLFVEVIGVVCWFNPFVWACKSALKSLHEYAADAAVINSNVSQNAYFDLILKQVRQQNRLAPVHSFSAWAIKRRIQMMLCVCGDAKFCVSTNRRRWLRYLSAVPVFALLVVGKALFVSAPALPIPMMKTIESAVSLELPKNTVSEKSEIPELRQVRKKPSREVIVTQETIDDKESQNVWESQSWLSIQYGDPVEIYEEIPISKQEEQYFVKTTGDVPVIYRVNTCDIPPLSH